MSVEIMAWVDKLAAIWEFSDGRSGTLKSYRLFERDEFPESLTVFPCALTIPMAVSLEYSAGGPCYEHWEGVTQFHLAANTSKAHIPYMLPFYRRITAAAAQNATLGGTVKFFGLRQAGDGGPSIEVRNLQYGSEPEHLGLVTYWKARVNVSGEFTVSA
jgi:hypothetical protein